MIHIDDEVDGGYHPAPSIDVLISTSATRHVLQVPLCFTYCASCTVSQQLSSGLETSRDPIDSGTLSLYPRLKPWLEAVSYTHL